MEEVLFAKTKHGFVDGTLTKPDDKSNDYPHWIRCDAMVKGWLKAAMTKDVRNSVRYATTAAEIWKDVKERYGKASAPRAYEVRRALSLLRQEGLGVSAYYTKLRGYWDELRALAPMPRCVCSNCTCDIQRSLIAATDREQLYMFLMGLNEAFGPIKTHILSLQPTPTMAQAFHLVLEDEQQRQISSSQHSTIEAAAFQSQRKSAVYNSGTRTTNYDRPKCTFCQRIRHVREECHQLVGYLEGWKVRTPRNNNRRDRASGRQPRAAHVDGSLDDHSDNPLNLTTQQLDQLMKLLNVSSPSGVNPSAATTMSGNKSHWVIDSASTDHITFDSNSLTQRCQSGNIPPVRIPNGDSIPVCGTGQKTLNASIVLTGVLDVPGFKCNLISVSRLTKDMNCSITFLRDHCVIQDLRTKKLIGMGELRDGLYYWKQDVSRQSHAMVSRRTISMDHWHRRLVHASSDKLKRLVASLSVDTISDLHHCDACIRAKQTRIVFPRSSIKSIACFELLHCDIWGDYKTASFTGAHYFLTIVDDFSRATWVFLMKSKSEVGTLLPSFCTMVQNQFSAQIRRIRADNGLEFQSASIRAYYVKHGIILERSCTDTPQQNGVVERKHRHLLDMARALRFQANLPIQFWGECVLTAAYLINRLPLKAIEN
ncbi:Retrovirus-related Pol polyprotein from transposon RE1 [Linum perenne]